MYETLTHYGIKGQKWGVRRYQNEDGGLTNAGKERYGEGKSNLKYKIRSDLGEVDAVSGAAPVKKSDSSAVKTANAATTPPAGMFGYVSKYNKEKARANLSEKLVKSGLGTVDGIKIVERKVDGGAIEYKASYYDAETKKELLYGIDQMDDLRDEIEKDLAYKKKIEEQRAKIREGLDNIDKVVSKILNKAKSAAVKVKDVAKSAIDYGALVVDEIFKKVFKHSAMKEVDKRFMGSNDILIHYGILGQKWGVRRYQLDDELVKKAYGVKK